MRALVSDPAVTYAPPSVTGAPEPDALVRAHMKLVRKIAWHVHGQVSSAIEVDDLTQIGLVALVEAAARYEPREGASFASYAAIRVRGAMLDHLRKQATLCRSAMVLRRQMTHARSKASARLGRAPTEAEIAVEMGMSMESYRNALDATRELQWESLDAVYSDYSLWYAEDSPDAETEIDRQQLAGLLRDAIGMLGQREAMVLQLYYVEELNLEEIGATLGVGGARVCQIKKAALEKLRHRLTGARPAG